MAHSGGLITKPVSFGDVNGTIGTSHTDLAALCKDGNINKWAWYKPISVAETGILTETQRQQAKYGLTPTYNALILAMMRQDVSHSDIAAEFSAAKAAVTEWTYTKPSGGASSPYRLTDFVENPATGAGRGTNGAYTNCGYYHSTKAPLKLGSLWEIGIDELKNVANNIIVETSGSGAGWSADPYTNAGSGIIGSGNAVKGSYCYEGLRYENYQARFGVSSEQNINMNDSYVIPINYIFNRNITQEDWRLGVIVKVNGISGNNVIPTTEVGMFVSRYSLSNIGNSIAQNVQQFSIDMCTNQTLAYKMATYVDSKGATEFECIPVFVLMSAVTIFGGGVNARTYQLLNGANATFYSIPEGGTSFTIKVKGGETPTPSGNESKTTGNWTLKTLFTGQYTGNSSTPSAQRYPINQIVIVWTGSGTPTASQTYNFGVDFDWQSYDGSNHNGTVNNNSISYTGNATITINGTTYYGRALQGGPNMTMNIIRTFSVS